VRWRVDGGAEHVGTRLLETAVVTGNGTHTLETRVRDVAGNYSSWRSESVNIDAVKPTDTTPYPVAPVPNGRKITLTGTDAHSGLSGAVEWQLGSGSIQTSAQATIVGAGSHTLKTRVQDNAGNWSDWRSGTVVVDPALPMEDSDAPIDTTTIPVNWRTGGYTVTVTADDAGGAGVDYVEWRLDGNPVQDGPSGSTFTVTTDGEHEIETRATDLAGNVSDWRAQTLKIDRTLPEDTTALPAGWTNTRTLTLTATDAASGVDRIEYKVDNGVSASVASGGTVTLPADGSYTISHRVHDVAGQLSAWKHDTYKVDTVLPDNTSAAAPSAWQTSALALPLTGTDALAGVDHAEWRVDGGDVQTGATATVATEGIQTLETRLVDKAGNASPWRTETVRVDRTKPVNTTPAVGAAWRKTNFTTTVTGSDATPGSGVLRIEYKLDNGAITTTPGVTISAEGSHKLETRVLDVAGNASDWRTDLIGIDKTVPTLAVNCGGDGWRATAAVCSVTAEGGDSGLPTLMAARGGGAPEDVTGGSYTVDADGATALSFRAVDGAGNETVATAAVKIDRTPPSAAVTCAPGAGITYVCKGSGADALSGLAGLNWSVDGSAVTGLANDGSFTATKGTVRVTAVDAAGNVAISAPLGLADRTPPPVKPKPTPTPTPHDDETITPRTTSDAVLLRRGGSGSARLLGQLSISATPTATTVDLRPLALGKGTFQFVIKVRTDKKSKTVRKTIKTKKGYSPRVRVKAAAAADAAVRLTVRRKSGRRWVTHAAGTATLE
jgi:hypothetical protein